MVTITITEPMLNQLTPALDDRMQRLTRDLVKRLLDKQHDDFAEETLRAAIRDLSNLRLVISEALSDPEYPEDMTLSSLEAETVVVWHEYLDR
jgi:hypothetical protein